MSARVVHKYPIVGLGAVIELPPTSKVAHFAEQHGALTVWIDRPVENDQASIPLELAIRGTGDPTPGGTWQHLGTALVAGGDFVFHLYGRTSA